MIIVMKRNAKEESIRKVLNLIESNNLEAHISNGKEVTIFLGDFVLGD